MSFITIRRVLTWAGYACWAFGLYSLFQLSAIYDVFQQKPDTEAVIPGHSYLELKGHLKEVPLRVEMDFHFYEYAVFLCVFGFFVMFAINRKLSSVGLKTVGADKERGQRP
jgi:hypothetical protein